MANRRKLWVDWTAKTLVRSDTNGAIVTLPTFHKYETIPFQVVILEPDPEDPLGAFTRLDATGVNLRMVINDTFDDGTPLVEQASWTADTATNILTAELELNTSAFNTYISTSDSKTAYFELQLIQDTCRSTIYRAQVNLRQGVATVATTSPDPAQVYRTAAESDGLYEKSFGSAGTQKTYVSPDGAWERVVGVDNDGKRIDDVFPA